jgi:hypothetical protein
VYEDADTAVDCAKVNDITCSAGCPVNMAPVVTPVGSVCDWIGCNQRVPVNGVCAVAGDVTSYCYSLEEPSGCYGVCPSHTTPNTQTSGNPKCVVTPCTSRTPDSRGVCLINSRDECYTYNGVCLQECPPGIEYGSDVDKVWRVTIFGYVYDNNRCLFLSANSI